MKKSEQEKKEIKAKLLKNSYVSLLLIILVVEN